jgi:hypothetical protein
MKDKKFLIALGVIALLALILLYVLIIGPTIQGYIVKKQIDAQENTIRAIVQVVGQQGYINLTDGNNSMVLIDSARLTTTQPKA